MSSMKRTYFHELYEGDADPWEFATSGYEQRKYSLTTASLPRAHYTSVFEPGCSIGVLTERLAPAAIEFWPPMSCRLRSRRPGGASRISPRWSPRHAPSQKSGPRGRST